MKLVHFLRKLVRETVTIELKDGTEVRGTIVGVDSAMTTHVRLVHVKKPGDQGEERLENMTIRGSKIRYIILPDVLNLDTLLIDDRPKKTRMRRGESKEEKENKPELFKKEKF